MRADQHYHHVPVAFDIVLDRFQKSVVEPAEIANKRTFLVQRNRFGGRRRTSWIGISRSKDLRHAFNCGRQFFGTDIHAADPGRDIRGHDQICN